MTPDNLLFVSQYQKRLKVHPEITSSSGYFNSPELNDQINQQVLEFDDRVLTSMHFHQFPFGLDQELISGLVIDHTVNRLAELGAYPEILRFSFVKNKHLAKSDLMRLMAKMRDYATQYNISVIFEDVLNADSEFPEWIICASAVGAVHLKSNLNSRRIIKGDKVIVSGAIGAHGLAMKNLHADLEDQYELPFDNYAVHRQIATLLHDFGGLIKFIKMPFDGVNSAFSAISQVTDLKLELFQSKVPVLDTTKHVAMLNDLNPVDLDNEGAFLCVVGQQKAHEVVNKLKTQHHGRSATIIGEVTV